MKERHRLLTTYCTLNEKEIAALHPKNGLSESISDGMVENAIGVFGLPLGVATNFVVDGESVLVPMAVEEPSVIAACSHMAKRVSAGGGFKTTVDDSITVAQILFSDLPDMDKACESVRSQKEKWVTLANKFCLSMKERGGGCTDIAVRALPSKDELGPFLSIDISIDCLDAMGANVVNTVAEGLLPLLQAEIGGRANMAILTNLSDRRLARAEFEIPFRGLASCADTDDGQQIAEAIVVANQIARVDPYRACTHNKGIFNGIDALAIASGNDWRALEAGGHAYACRSGQYGPLTHYEINRENGTLIGRIELPVAVGVVGGSTKSHPAVKTVYSILDDFGQCAKKLAGLMASVGLAQNLGALRALTFEGIQRGHMRLHARKKEFQKSG